MATVLQAAAIQQKLSGEETCGSSSRNCRHQTCQYHHTSQAYHLQPPPPSLKPQHQRHQHHENENHDNNRGTKSLILSSDDDEEDENVFNDLHDDNNDEDDLDEIPVWVRGEQRWISGLTKDTTCAQLVDALLRDEGIDVSGSVDVANQYVITERWRQVEQILNNSTKILKIWTAWGEAQSEVRLSLRRIEFSPNGSYRPWTSEQNSVSGRHSPSNRSNGGAVSRRKRQRSATKSTWTATTTTPVGASVSGTLGYASGVSIPQITAETPSSSSKTQKPTIEKLMQLILEQGETIQQQLTQLRDRELQIANIEKTAYYRLREGCSENGKKYLLEAYLSGIQGSGSDGDTGGDGGGDGGGGSASTGDENKDNANANSDSGVHTGEEVTTTPELEISRDVDIDVTRGTVDNAEIAENGIGNTKENGAHVHMHPHKKTGTSGLSKREYELLKEHECSREFLQLHSFANLPELLDDIDDGIAEDDTYRQIEMLQKLIVINKHLQREEELLVRLSAKIRKYECNGVDMSEPQMREAIEQVNRNIEHTTGEMEHIEREIQASGDILQAKSEVIYRLSKELEELELIDVTAQAITVPVPVLNATQCSNQMLDYKLISDNCSNQINPGVVYQGFYPTLMAGPCTATQQMILNQPPAYFHKDDLGCSPVNIYGNQRNVSQMGETVCKLGPKKMLNGLVKDPDSDTGISSLGEDMSMLGTLV